ncbi:MULTISPECIES: TetR/AcrR family transcriptional regulator [unclassified Pseudomonas]|uniref:TetR/AcrR family transcriptional regulator n=1 Tax=unclassified Pseudomonas TaxID=196821 RepID=UPI001F5931CD|nr:MULTISPECIES: TetR/AcrR family transcriptional regulator [unclassified Pseudomonas]
MTRIDRRKEILDAALQLFQKKGLAHVTTRDLAASAGLSRSHIYHYFNDWKALRLEAFVYFASLHFEAVCAPLRDMQPVAALVAFVQDCLPTSAQPRWALWLDAWSEAICDEELAHAYLEANTQWQTILAGIIKRGILIKCFRSISPDRAARQIFSVTMGYANDLLLKPSPELAKVAIEEVMENACMLLGFSEYKVHI